MNETNGTHARLKAVEKQVDGLGHIPERLAVVEHRVGETNQDIIDLRTDVKALRRALWAATATFTISIIGWVITLLQIAGNG